MGTQTQNECPLAERLPMNEFNIGATVYVDARNGELVFTMEMDGALPVAVGANGNEPPSNDELSLDKLMIESM